MKRGRFSLEEIQDNLFTADISCSLAHCVSQDLAMGKGIAFQFKRIFGGVEELKTQSIKVGRCGILSRDKRHIFYLVTKSKYWQKPTMETLQSSLERMLELAQEKGVATIAMPRIGCGLDKLEWKEVKKLIERVFGESDIHIQIYFL